MKSDAAVKRQKAKPIRAQVARRVAAPLFLYGASQLVVGRANATSLTTEDTEGHRAKTQTLEGPRRGAELGEIGVIEDGAMLISGGKIVAVGTTKELMRDAWLKKNRGRVQELDCAGKVVTPGFVDSHTHPVFARPRLVDFEKRVAGATYEEIAEAGGGIRASIKGVREASLKELTELTLETFREMASYGTTTVEAKSGYGLNYESEMKSLEAIKAAGKHWAGTVVATLLAAHTVPPEFKKNPQDYVRMICQVMIPEVADRELAKYVDVFCEKGAFTSADTERIFAAAEGNRLEVRAHMCQLSHTKLASLIERFRPASVDHMDYVSDEDVAAMATMDTVATLVPGANYFLGTKQYPPARQLIDAGVPVALATDYNPGSSPTASMPMVMSIACTQMKMTPAEALAAATINGAWALGMADRKGSLEPGKDADVAIFEAEDYREIAYWFGGNRCVGTMAAGEWVGRAE